MLIEIPKNGKVDLSRFFSAVKQRGGRALFVGGCVRDALRGDAFKDFDIEVYGVPATEIETLLRRLKIRYNAAGRSFGVFKIHEASVDIALPRRESKCGLGHTGFSVEGDPNMSLAEAAARRDFTVNAIYYDPLTDEISDPFDGRGDLEKKILRHTSPAFSEDPLRVLRAMQFLARFRFEIAPETLELCKKIEPEGLSRERIFDEWKKLFTKGEEPSRGLNFLRECGWVKYFPELAALIGVEQDPFWHPEGDVWNHTLRAMDAFARERADDDAENIVVGFAVLCHDFGKPATTALGADGRIHSYRHESAGVKPTIRFLKSMTDQRDLLADVPVLVEAHMRPRALFLANSGDAAIRRLSRAVGRIDRLLRVCKADAMGSRFHESEDFQETERWLTSRAEALDLKVAAPKALVLGRHLIALGFKPGAHFSKILDRCFEAQLDGEFSDESGGVAYLKKMLQSGEKNPVPA